MMRTEYEIDCRSVSAIKLVSEVINSVDFSQTRFRLKKVSLPSKHSSPTSGNNRLLPLLLVLGLYSFNHVQENITSERI
jgi:hypothetical protein